RLGALRGRVRDERGRPAAGAIVTVDFQPPAKPRAPEAARLQFSTLRGANPLRADPKGGFEIPDFPWKAASVTLRAVLGNSLAEWTGPAEALAEVPELRLQPARLATATGRLVDPQRRPLTGARF